MLEQVYRDLNKKTERDPSPLNSPLRRNGQPKTKLASRVPRKRARSTKRA